jgi:hypothetical protein
MCGTLDGRNLRDENVCTVTFILEIKHLARQPVPCSQFYPQKLWGKVLLKKRAVNDCCCISKTWTDFCGLAHNIVHRICVESEKICDAGPPAA